MGPWPVLAATGRGPMLSLVAVGGHAKLLGFLAPISPLARAGDSHLLAVFRDGAAGHVQTVIPELPDQLIVAVGVLLVLVVDQLLEGCRSCERIRVTGLMTVPPASTDPEASRPVFAALRELGAELRRRPGGDTLRELSMGMSADFEVAIEEGATIVRVGTAIFGPREE